MGSVNTTQAQTDGQVLTRVGGGASWQTPVDNNTTYTAGNGITIEGTTNSIRITPTGTDNQVLTSVNGLALWRTPTDGDITRVIAGDGLTGGGTIGDVTLTVDADNGLEVDAPADLRTNHILVFNDLNLQEAGLYSVVFKTEDNSGNRSREFTLYFDVNYNYEVVVNGINDLALADMINVSPNPTNGPVNISVNLPENEEVSIAIFNTMGQQVATVANGKVSNGSFSVNLQGNTNGMYYVKMNLNGTIVTKKIILNN